MAVHSVQVAVAGDRELLAKLSKFNLAARARVVDAINVAALAVQAAAKKGAPVDTGRLRSAIRITFYKVGIAAEVGAYVDYAAAVEFGSRAHMPPAAALEEWARRHKMPRGAGYAIARAIAKRGTKPRPFLYPAFELERRDYLPRLAKAMNVAIQQSA